eukprot:9474147-Pyramimonas_sp.AAC.1
MIDPIDWGSWFCRELASWVLLGSARERRGVSRRVLCMFEGSTRENDVFGEGEEGKRMMVRRGGGLGAACPRCSTAGRS